MRSFSSTVEAALADPVGVVLAPRLTIYLDAGTVSWTSADEPSIGFEVEDLITGSALDPASLQVTVYSQAVQSAAQSAASPYRGKRLVLDLLVTTSAGQEALLIFDGAVTQVKGATLESTTLLAEGALSRARVRSGSLELGLLCPFVFGDAQCGASQHTEDRTADAGCTTTQIRITSAYSQVNLGDRLELASGEAALVRSAASSLILNLDRPLSAAPSAGDTITLRWQCQKNVPSCNRHSNMARFGGCAWMPAKSIESGA